ncbi:MAG: tripartite tricarboxylate transporter substrate binding protein [Burkholderiales bacterium]|nr:tripartite tricarboxylate transporter substrate binding protein [Burkholderiales bacterium]
MIRRTFAVALASALAFPAFAQAPAWPAAQPVIAVVPFSPGGSVDVAARITMPRLAEKLRQTVVVENTVGASGTIAAQRVINARADGYTLFFAVNSPVTVAPLVSPNTYKYDGLRDLVPVATVASSPFVLVGRPTLPAANASELVKLIRSQPGKLNFGTDGVGTGLHVTAEMLKQRAALDMVHVPYKSGPQVLTEVAGGQIDLAVLPVALVQAFVRDGKVRAYGVTSAQRWATLPDVPALAETAEFKGFDVNSWVGLLLPAHTDRAIVDRLAQAVNEMVAEPETQKKLSDAGYKPLQLSGPAFAAYLAQERKDLAATIAAAKIRID